MNQVTGDIRAQIEVELEGWRRDFDNLIEAIDPDAWEAPSGNAGWNVRQVAGHLAAQPDASVRLVGVARNGKTMLKGVPHRVLDWISLWLVRLTTRGLTPEGARARYDAGDRRLIALLATVGDGEFGTKGVAFGQALTVADAFRELGRQFEAHTAEIRAGLETAARQTRAERSVTPRSDQQRR